MAAWLLTSWKRTWLAVLSTFLNVQHAYMQSVIAGIYPHFEADATLSELIVPFQFPNAESTSLVLTFTGASPFANSGVASTVSFLSSYSPTWTAFSTTHTSSADATGKILTVTFTAGTFAANTMYYLRVVEGPQTFASLPAAGTAVTVSIEGSGSNTVSTPMSFQTVPRPTVALTMSGSTPTGITFTFTLPADHAGGPGETLAIAATAGIPRPSSTGSSNLFVAGQTSGATVTGGTLSTVTSTAAGVTLTLSAAVVAGTAMTITLASPLLAASLPSAAYSIGMAIYSTAAVGTDPAVISHYMLDGVNAAAVGNDPIARMGDRVVKFSLQPGVLTNLLTAPDIAVHGSVFEGDNPGEQWFNRVVITPATLQNRFIDIRIKPDLRDALDRNRTADTKRGAFRTLEVDVGWGSVDAPLKVAAVANADFAVPDTFLGQQIGFHQTKRHHTGSGTSPMDFPRECLDLAGGYLHLLVCSSKKAIPAYLASKHAHLDIMVAEAKSLTQLTGLLPELWGVRPMSEATKACVQDAEDEQVNRTIESCRLLGEGSCAKEKVYATMRMA
eukprot:TRINITY_DN60075_c0_g1_i1.p1 TRINITY_DN60075_c0_g1~~TRINITY_DN60075_c0_g1_i1.p1  ORF type:complete len:571 (-),score=89.76 TRINITY_DN60075_c0_g1_i1:355-2028(-)